MAHIPTHLLGEITNHRLRADVIEMGHLYVPSGKIVVCDPLADLAPNPLARTVEPGQYPVELLVDNYQPDQEYNRVGAAILWFRKGKPSSFEMAVWAGQDISRLGKDEFYGYGVDGGMGCFGDVEAVNRTLEHEHEMQKSLGEKFVSYYDDVLYGQMEKDHNFSWLMHTPYPNRQLNLAIFSSGDGDGFYGSYWGLNESGDALCLVTDFGVFDES